MRKISEAKKIQSTRMIHMVYIDKSEMNPMFVIIQPVYNILNINNNFIRFKYSVNRSTTIENNVISTFDTSGKCMIELGIGSRIFHMEIWKRAT